VLLQLHYGSFVAQNYATDDLKRLALGGKRRQAGEGGEGKGEKGKGQNADDGGGKGGSGAGRREGRRNNERRDRSGEDGGQGAQHTNQHQYQSFSELPVGTPAGAMRSTSLDSVTTLVDAMPADKSKMTMAPIPEFVVPESPEMYSESESESESGSESENREAEEQDTRLEWHAEGQDAEKERSLTRIEWFHFLIDQTIRRYALLEESLPESESESGYGVY
jgi:hypothetical protein